MRRVISEVSVSDSFDRAWGEYGGKGRHLNVFLLGDAYFFLCL